MNGVSCSGIACEGSEVQQAHAALHNILRQILDLYRQLSNGPFGHEWHFVPI